jgi:hypothetical protein
LAAASQLCLQFSGAVAIATGPRLGAVPVAASPPSVRILNREQLEVFFPIGTFFRERSRAETDFHPMNRSIVGEARTFHIIEVFVAGDGTLAERLIADRPEQVLFASRFHSSLYQVSH